MLEEETRLIQERIQKLEELVGERSDVLRREGQQNLDQLEKTEYLETPGRPLLTQAYSA